MQKRYFCIMALSALILAGSQMVQAQDAPNVVKSEVVAAAPQNVGNKICPVSGGNIDEATKATYEYEGKIYNLCGEKCIEEFKKDPKKYDLKVQEELSAKTSAETTPATPAKEEKKP